MCHWENNSRSRCKRLSETALFHETSRMPRNITVHHLRSPYYTYSVISIMTSSSSNPHGLRASHMTSARAAKPQRSQETQGTQGSRKRAGPTHPSSNRQSLKKSRPSQPLSQQRQQAPVSSYSVRHAPHPEPQELQDPFEEPEDDDSLHEAIMAIDMRNRDSIGCSYYVAREEKLYLLNDVSYGGLDIIDTC